MLIDCIFIFLCSFITSTPSVSFPLQRSTKQWLKSMKYHVNMRDIYAQGTVQLVWWSDYDDDVTAKTILPNDRCMLMCWLLPHSHSSIMDCTCSTGKWLTLVLTVVISVFLSAQWSLLKCLSWGCQGKEYAFYETEQQLSACLHCAHRAS